MRGTDTVADPETHLWAFCSNGGFKPSFREIVHFYANLKDL